MGVGESMGAEGAAAAGTGTGAALEHPRASSLLPVGEGAPGVLSARDLHIARKQKKQSLILSKPNNIMYID